MGENVSAVEKLDDLLDRYFQIGFQQGLENRTHDDREGSAQDACEEIRSAFSALARQAEALQRENAELRETLAGDHEIKPLSEERLDEILEFEERFKMLGGAGDTASLDWATQRALIDEAVLACRARALLGGSENAE